jgi:ribonuclease Z
VPQNDANFGIGALNTRYNENVIRYGAGADLLIHEVASAQPELTKEAYIRRIIAHHTTRARPAACSRRRSRN